VVEQLVETVPIKRAPRPDCHAQGVVYRRGSRSEQERVADGAFEGCVRVAASRDEDVCLIDVAEHPIAAVRGPRRVGADPQQRVDAQFEAEAARCGGSSDDRAARAGAVAAVAVEGVAVSGDPARTCLFVGVFGMSCVSVHASADRHDFSFTGEVGEHGRRAGEVELRPVEEAFLPSGDAQDAVA
jgi:hypothetical protein